MDTYFAGISTEFHDYQYSTNVLVRQSVSTNQKTGYDTTIPAVPQSISKAIPVFGQDASALPLLKSDRLLLQLDALQQHVVDQGHDIAQTGLASEARQPTLVSGR